MEALLGLFAFALFLAPFIVGIVNFNRIKNLTLRLQHLERMSVGQGVAIEELRNRTVAPPPKVEPEKSARRDEPVPVVSKISEQTPATVTGEPATVPEQMAFIEPPISPRPIFAPTESFIPKKSRSNKEWEALIGGKVLNRIGAVALIIGIGFFLKYAFDNNWISETVRVLMGAAAGLALLYGGRRSHKKDFKVFGQGLVGAGIAVLYLSVYAAFNFYHLVPQVVAFGLMSGVTALTLLQAWKYDSPAVALLGWAGGFLTPFMLSTGSANEIGLFTYIALLDAGLLAVALSKEKWYVIEPLTLVSTALIYSMWCSEYYTPEDLMPTLFFTTVFWVLFFGVEAIQSLRRVSLFTEFRQIFGVALAGLYFAALYELFEPDHHAWMGTVTLVIGVPYFTLFWMLRGRGEIEQFVLSRYVLTAMALLFTGTAIHFYGFTTAMLWSVEALAVVYFGSKWNMKYMWTAAIIMFALTVFKLFVAEGFLEYRPLAEFRLLLNRRALAFVVVGAAMIASAELFRLRDEKLAKDFKTLLSYVSCFVFFVLVSVETVDLFDRWMLYVDGSASQFLAFRRDLTLGVVWMAYSILLAIVGFKRNIFAFLHSSILVLALSILLGVFRGFGFDPIEQYTLLLNYRVLVLVLLVIGCVRHAWWWRREGKDMHWGTLVLQGIGISIVVLIFVLLTSEVVDFFAQRIVNAQALINADSKVADSGRIESYRNLQQLWLSGVWLFYSIVMLVAGIWKRFRALRIIAIVLFGITILKIFIFDLSFLETLYRIISFMGLGVILLGVSYLYQKYKGIILDTEGNSTKSSSEKDSLTGTPRG